MSTLGYKIGLFNSLYRHDLFPYNSGRARWVIKTYPALITLEIPDDAVVSTPEVRSNIFKHANITYDPIEPLNNDILKEAFVKLCAYWPYDTYEGLHKNEKEYMFLRDVTVSEYMFLRDVMVSVKDYKCRCNKAKVINTELLEEDGYIASAFTNYHNSLNHDKYFYYKRGEIVYPNKFDTYLTKVCSHGIHYFEDPRLAILYAFDFYHEFAHNICDHSKYICHKYFDIKIKEN